MAGRLVTEEAKRLGVTIFPVDSEHSAIFQSMEGHRRENIRKLILTASGGPLLKTPLAKMRHVTTKQALKHPNWKMGAKITIDSATLMNKGLEVIEARWLFDIPPSRIEVMVHPQSVIHSMVEYVDGSVIAQLGIPDMRAPLSYALSYPDRLALELHVARGDEIHPADDVESRALGKRGGAPGGQDALQAGRRGGADRGGSGQERATADSW